jgi:hypothetical protein
MQWVDSKIDIIDFNIFCQDLIYFVAVPMAPLMQQTYIQSSGYSEEHRASTFRVKSLQSQRER